MSEDKGKRTEPPFHGEKTDWYGYDRYEFTVDGRMCYLVPPKEAAPGRPWIWRARFFGAWPGVDLALLEKGFHLAYIDVVDLFGNAQAQGHWNAFYRYVTETHGLSRRVTLEAMSRGGLIAYAWAAKNPEKVTCIYADAPVCDIRSWPGGKGVGEGSQENWAKCLRAHGLTEDEALRFADNPIDGLQPLSAAGIPLLHVCGDADRSVPMEENTGVLAERYRKLGGHVQVIAKPGCGHHPHSLEDPTPIVDFILKHTNRRGRIEIVCHKGANEYAPENTYAAAQRCIDWGMDYVEIDVNTSVDGVLYLMHGPAVDRTTNGTGLFSELTSEQIDRLDAGSWFSPEFAGERVPRLHPFLRWIKGKAKVFFDVKSADHRQLIDLIHEVGLENDCFFWSGSDTWARKLREMAPDLKLKINAGNAEGVMAAHGRYRADIVEVRLSNMSRDLMDACRKLGIVVMIYHQEKDPEAFRRVLEWGVDMINLNHGDVFARIAEEFYANRP